VSIRYLTASVAVTAIVVVTVWLTDLSFQRAALLAPVLVLGIAAAAGLAVFWGRVGWESLRTSRRPRVVLAASVAVVALLVLLTILGVKLPHE